MVQQFVTSFLFKSLLVLPGISVAGERTWLTKYTHWGELDVRILCLTTLLLNDRQQFKQCTHFEVLQYSIIDYIKWQIELGGEITCGSNEITACRFLPTLLYFESFIQCQYGVYNIIVPEVFYSTDTNAQVEFIDCTISGFVDSQAEKEKKNS